MSASVKHRRLIACGDLPGSNGGIYNPGALVDGPVIRLLCRRELDYRFQPHLAFPELVTLDRATLALVDYRTLTKVGFAADTRIEDFRCLAFRGLRLVVHSTVCRDGIRPMISRMFDDALQRFDDLDLPMTIRPVEKNWVLFEHDDALHCLYGLDPLRIFRRAGDGTWSLVVDADNGWAAGLERTLSNSTNLIPFDDGYLGFWHTIVCDRYVQGAFLLGHDLSIQSRTGVLLDGAWVRDGFKPGVLYVSALVEDAGRVLAFYGEGDAHTGVALFDRAELAQELRRSPFVSQAALRIRFDGRTLAAAFRAVQAVRTLAEGPGSRPVRLLVSEPALRPTVARLLPSGVVADAGAVGPHDGAIDPETGVLHWTGDT